MFHKQLSALRAQPLVNRPYFEDHIPEGVLWEAVGGGYQYSQSHLTPLQGNYRDRKSVV